MYEWTTEEERQLPHDRLDGRGVVVIGGAGAIGTGIARAFAGAGAELLVADLAGEALDRAAAEVGGSASTVDVTDPGSVAELAEVARDRLGAVDVLVNCAGIVVSATVVDTAPADWDRVMAVNATGTFLACRAFVPGMVANGRGSVINISSINGKQGQEEMGAYSASKFAVIGLTQSLAMEVAADGVQANCICPGVVHTPMLDALLAVNGRTLAEELKELQLIQRPQTPEEIGRAAVFLATMPSITGQAVNVDGGCIFS